MPDFFTKDGRVHPITPRRGRGFVAAAAAGVALSLAGAGLDGAEQAAAGRVLRPGVQQTVSPSQLARSRRAARQGRPEEAWRRLSLRRLRRTARARGRALDCVAHSFGEVRRFLLRTRCHRLHRALVLLGDGRGNDLAVAVAWVRMAGPGDARRFRRLEDRYGTGDITPLAGGALGLAGLRFTGRHYASRRTGSLVVVAETEPVSGHPDSAVLRAVAEVAVWFPPP